MALPSEPLFEPKPLRLSKSLHVPVFSNVVVVLSSVIVTTPSFVYLVIKGSERFAPELNDRPCISDGTFVASLFSINLAYGRYNFATVKLIDVLWDVLIGRGL